MEQNKTGKYFKYAIGEIVLVVIGILIALMLNSKKELNTNKSQIEGIIKSISKSLVNDMKSVKAEIKESKKQFSLTDIILNKEHTASDYEQNDFFNDFTSLTGRTMEVIQFESQSYDRLIGKLEIVPEDYNSIIEVLQNVYSVHTPTVTIVSNELKNYLSGIEDSRRTTYNWYSDTEKMHRKQRLHYYLNDPQYFNDIKRLGRHFTHVNGHLNQLESAIAIAYNKIHRDLTPEAPFSEHIIKFELAEPGELEEFIGEYKAPAIKSAPFIPDTITFEAEDYSMYILPMNFIIIKSKKDLYRIPQEIPIKFNFKRDENGKVISVNAEYKAKLTDTIWKTDVYKKIN